MIYRQRTGKNFTIVNNEYLQDENLSFKAKGLLTYLLSLPDNWKIKVLDLMNRSKDGRDSITTAINELIDNYYCLRFQLRNNVGQFDSHDYVVSDIKMIDPDTGNPYTDEQITDNPTLLNTNIKINTNNSKDIDKTKKRKKSFLFIDSKCNNFEYFKNGLIQQFGDNVNYELYYQKAKAWSNAKNKKSFDWIEEIKIWIMQDIGVNIKQQQSEVTELESLKTFLSE